MPTLYTFQRLTRVEQLKTEGTLTASWTALSPFERAVYPSMVEAMRKAGIPIKNNPPIWAWTERPTLLDAALLLNPEHELSKGYATIEFEAPENLTHLSDYSAWNDHMAEKLRNPTATWKQKSKEGNQATLPWLSQEWVKEVRPLPTTGWNKTENLEKPA
nr:hypothetical protein [Kibdelosporangium sp. MJ126-NF4]